MKKTHALAFSFPLWGSLSLVLVTYSVGCFSASVENKGCAYWFVNRLGAERVILEPALGVRLRDKIQTLPDSLVTIAAELGVSRRFLSGVFVGEKSLDYSLYQQILGKLQKADQSDFTARKREGPRSLEGLPVRVKLTPEFRRLLQSYRQNFLGRYDEIGPLLGVTTSHFYQLLDGQKKSVPRDRFLKMLTLLHIEEGLALSTLGDPEAAWGAAASETEPGQWNDAEGKPWKWLRSPSAESFQALSRLLICLAAPEASERRGAREGLRLLWRGWYLAKTESTSSVPPALEFREKMDAAIDQLLAVLEKIDVRLPLSSYLEKSLSSPASLAALEEVSEWTVYAENLDRDAIQRLAAELPAQSYPSKAFMNKWNAQVDQSHLSVEALVKMTGVPRPRLDTLRKGEATHFSAEELVTLAAAASLPLRDSVRLAYDPGPQSEWHDRVFLTEPFRSVSESHRKDLNLGYRGLDERAGFPEGTSRRALMNIGQSLSRDQLARWLAALNMTELAARTLLGANLICDPDEDPQFCRLEGLPLEDKIIPLIVFLEAEWASRDFTLMAYRLSAPELFDREETRKQLIPRLTASVWKVLAHRVNHPKTKRQLLALPLAVENIIGSWGQSPLFRPQAGPLTQVSEASLRAARVINELPPSHFLPPPFRYH